ncbi:NAD(P)-binding protein [Thozetella sp. PMI_491]|nr:NAD(P)-binding protein [Thozetella sp. PMI_491]
MARGFAQQGSKVVILDLVPPKTVLPASVSYYKADVTSSQAIRDVAAQIRKEIGDPTVLINNAGVGTVLPILDGTEESNRRTLEVNILAHFITIREFLPSMIKHNHGHVVSIASAASFVTIAGNVDYSCSKAGLVSLHEGLVQELRHFYKAPHVRSSIFHPSWIKTPLLEPLLELRKFNDALLEPDFVANAVVDHVRKGESGQVILPTTIGFVLRSLKSLPLWLQEGVRNSRAGLLKELPNERPELPK